MTNCSRFPYLSLLRPSGQLVVRQCALVLYVYHSKIGDWVIDARNAAEGVQLRLHTRSGRSERIGIYQDPEQAAGAVQCQMTGVYCWDSLSAVPDMSNVASWERVESYP